jgi:hypothetical protein
VICYQEQVMQVSRVLCGYTPGEADMLRKIMGKKLPEEMKKQRDKFVTGAVTLSGMDQQAADKLFTDIEGFAGYAFNRSHAVEYTLISYQAAYIKAHYLVEFYAASMGIASSHAAGDRQAGAQRWNLCAAAGREQLDPPVRAAQRSHHLRTAVSRHGRQREGCNSDHGGAGKAGTSDRRDELRPRQGQGRHQDQLRARSVRSRWTISGTALNRERSTARQWRTSIASAVSLASSQVSCRPPTAAGRRIRSS